MSTRNLSEIFVQTHFLLRKIHYWQGRVLSDGVSFRHGEPNGGGWFWWWNWRAFACIALALALVTVATLGTMKGQTYVSKDTLWIPQNSPILADKHTYEELFGSADIARIMFTANPGYDPNLMHYNFFASLWRLHTFITTKLTVTVNGKHYGFNDICVNVTLLGVTGCYQYNPLAFWPAGVGPGSFQRPSYNVGAAINDPASLFFNPWTKVEDILGGTTRVNDEIVAITALQVHYFFDNSPERLASNPDWSEVLQSYEDALLAALKRYTFAEIAPNINLSYNKEIYSSMVADWPFLGASVCIMLAILSLGFLSMDFIHHSRIFLGVMAALTIAFSITSTQGAASLLFLSETVFDTYAIFLVAIIGLNHLYIIIHTYDRVIDKELLKTEPQVQKGQVNHGSLHNTDKHGTYRLLVTETLAEAMPSITAVYLIGIPIFAIGILSEYCFEYEPIAGLISLSSTCAFGMLVLYISLNLFFLPALALDALRIVENRLDVLCLKREPDTYIRAAPVIGDVIEVATDVTLPPPPPYERLCHVVFRKAFSPVMTKLPIKIAIVSVVILALGLSIFVVANTHFALRPHPRQDNLPSDNYLAAYYGVQSEFFDKVGTPASLILVEADYTKEKTFHTINSFLDQLGQKDCVQEGSVGNWYSDYINYLASKGQNITDFYQYQDQTNVTNLAVWLDSPSGGQYAKRLIFNQDQTVKASAFTFNLVPVPPSDRERSLDYAHSLRNMVKSNEAIQRLSSHHAIIYSEEFVFIDEPWMLTKAWVAKVIVYLVLFLLFSLVFLDFRSVLLIVIATASVASLIYGVLMYFLSMNISVYSISCLIMMSMVSFDFFFQVAYFWMRDKGPRTARLMNVVNQIGTSLCCAYFTQFFGMMALMFSLSSPINRAFAYLYVSITSFSFVLAVVVLPIVLSWVGLRRNRIVFQRKYRSVLGGAIWEARGETAEDDNYWSSDDESSFYHDPDRESHNLAPRGSSFPGLSDDDTPQHESLEKQPPPAAAATAGMTTGDPVATTGSVDGTIARSLAGGGHEVTLEQLFVIAERASMNQPPRPLSQSQPQLHLPSSHQTATETRVLAISGGGVDSSGYEVTPKAPQSSPEQRQSADLGSGGSGTTTRPTAGETHRRTGSGLRDLFFGGGGGLTMTDGLDSFPSPSPATPSILQSGRWSREGSWLSSSSSRTNSKFTE